jgi:arsenite methyltransferase
MNLPNSTTTAAPKRADYGIDAPPMVRNLVLAGIGAVALGAAAYALLAPARRLLAALLGGWGIVAGSSMLLTAGLMLWSSKVGKLRERDRLLAMHDWRGDEIVLDVGCGPGLLLIGAARRLTVGKAIGVDIWQRQDESGNRPERTWANAQAEGVAERIELKTADMRELPFEDGSVDLVVSSLALHNIYDPTGRAAAVREIARVLRPGGQALILDFQRTDEYAAALRELGWSDVQRTARRLHMFPPVRWVTGTKPIQ